jgi:processive 1,2-diacylglycerol beta-glucosyltransferase
MQRSGLIAPFVPAALTVTATSPRPAGGRLARRTIVVLSVSAGNGHVRAAQALCSAGATDPAIEMVHLDVMQFVPRAFRKIYTDLYLQLVRKFPLAWSALYHYTDRAAAESAGQRWRRLVERLCMAQLRRRLAELTPDAIICTHFLPAEMLCALPAAERPAGGVWVQITDYGLHSMWLQPGVSGYFVGSEELAWQLRQRGVGAHQVHVTGIPVMPAFSNPPGRAQAAASLGLDPLRPTVLLMGGGHGHGDLLRITSDLIALEQRPTVLVATGNNAGLRAALTSLASAYPIRLRVLGYTNQMAMLMACADFVISKPGGLTTAECLAMGLPMIAVESIPGQEERNADYLLEHGAALKAASACKVEYRVRQLLSDPARLASMQEAARTLGQAHAGRDALRIVCHALGMAA